jgi:hypothetical protein
VTLALLLLAFIAVYAFIAWFTLGPVPGRTRRRRGGAVSHTPGTVDGLLSPHRQESPRCRIWRTGMPDYAIRAEDRSR